MKNLFEPMTILEIKKRLELLQKNNTPKWGNMQPAQMMAHCSLALENALGEKKYSVSFLLKLWAILFRKSNRDRYVNDSLFQPSKAINSKNAIIQKARTDNPFAVTDNLDFNTQKLRLLNLINQFFKEGQLKCKNAEHPTFGKFTPKEWAIGQFKHLDYHLRQFGV